MRWGLIIMATERTMTKAMMKMLTMRKSMKTASLMRKKSKIRV